MCCGRNPDDSAAEPGAKDSSALDQKDRRKRAKGDRGTWFLAESSSVPFQPLFALRSVCCSVCTHVSSGALGGTTDPSRPECLCWR